MKSKEPWITAAQAAERLSMHRSRIYRLLQEHVLRRVWLKLPNPHVSKSRGRYGVSIASVSQYEHSLALLNERETTACEGEGR